MSLFILGTAGILAGRFANRSRLAGLIATPAFIAVAMIVLLIAPGALPIVLIVWGMELSGTYSSTSKRSSPPDAKHLNSDQHLRGPQPVRHRTRRSRRRGRYRHLWSRLPSDPRRFVCRRCSPHAPRNGDHPSPRPRQRIEVNCWIIGHVPAYAALGYSPRRHESGTRWASF